MTTLRTLFACVDLCASRTDDDFHMDYADKPMPPSGFLAPPLPLTRPPNPNPGGSSQDRRRARRAKARAAKAAT